MITGPKNAEWTPHIWEGSNFFAWIRLLAINRFAVSPRYWWVVAIASIVTFIHSIGWLMQQIFWRHRVRRVPVPDDPIFILGHWRTGTTFLHELLIRDPRHTYPNYYQCMDPNHPLLSEGFMTTTMPFLLPKRRPMDDLPIGWDRPQEDEFALCLLGQPSFYNHLGFPNRWPADFDWLDFRGISERRRQKWADALAGFLHQLAFKNPGRRFVLKSPPHTARIATLLKRFPRAKFIHIVRDPYRVFPSTVRLWSALYANHTLQVPDGKLTEKIVIEAGRRLFDAFERDRKLLSTQQLFELRYEDLMADPLGRLDDAYRQLGLGDFATARPHCAAYVAAQKDFVPPSHDVPPDVRAIVDEHWGYIVQRYGYSEAKSAAVTDCDKRLSSENGQLFGNVDSGKPVSAAAWETAML